MSDKGMMVFVPPGHAVRIFPVPAISNSTDDDGAAIINNAAAHAATMLDDGEDG